jgi:hypothetical protein
MELNRFDLIVLKNTLRYVIETEGDKGLFKKKILQSTESAVVDILTEYPNTTVFLVQPDKLEE